jgi:hypothetical protein
MAKARSKSSVMTDAANRALARDKRRLYIMERTPITSTTLNAVGYDEDSQTLEMEFKTGSVYQYAGVPSSEFEGLMNADSKGKYFNANIKNRYPFTKL